MTRYTNVKVNISEGQKEKLQHTIKAGCPAVSIRLGNDILAVTGSQAKKLAKAHENGKGITIRMNSSQLKHNCNNKMEMKEIYPRLPTAPPIEDQGQGNRLQKINENQACLEKEVATREALSK